MLIYHQIHKCKNDHTMMNICVAKMDLIPNEICTKCIIDFCEKYNDVIHKEINNKNSNTMIFFAHHCYIKKCYDEMKKYCHDAIEHGNNIAFYYLANYYETIEKNYDLTKQYYLCGIQKNDHNSMLGLGYYYDEIENDYDQAKKYYLMAVNYGNFFAMNNSTCGIIQILVQSNSGRTNNQLPPKQEFGPIPGTVISSSISYVPSCFVKATCSYSGQTLSCANNINSPN